MIPRHDEVECEDCAGMFVHDKRCPHYFAQWEYASWWPRFRRKLAHWIHPGEIHGEWL